MKIRHNITRTWCTLSGQILETIFEEGEKRSDHKEHYSKDKSFLIKSGWFPELTIEKLYVHWCEKENDNQTVSHTYSSESEAQNILDCINEFSVDTKPVSKTLTYQTQYVRSDGVIFTEDSVWGKKIEDLKKEASEAQSRINTIRGLLKTHANKFSK